MRLLVASSRLCSLDWDMPQVTRFVVFGGSATFAWEWLTLEKVLQRIYKYGGQPFVRDYLAKHHGAEFDNAFGKGTGKAIMHATAGR